MKKLIPVIILFLLNLSCSDIINGLFDDMPEIVPVCVVQGISSGGDGRGWVNAVPQITDALALVKEGGEIWIKSGTYDIGAAIDIGGSVENISIFGGFAGTESRKEQRDATANETLLKASGTNGIISFTDARSITIDGFSFTGPVSGLGSYSAVKVNSSEGIVFRSCVFDSLTGTGSGKAIYVTGNSEITVTDAEFKNNEADDGGAICAVSGAVINISASDFISNSANDDGGALFIDDNSTAEVYVNISGSNFINNNAGSGLSNIGGALYAHGSNISITNNSRFDGNSSGQGGAIYAYEDTNITINDTELTNNSTTSNGGAIFINNTPADINNSTLSGNYTDSGEDGGALYIESSNVNILNSKLQNNGYTGTTTYTRYGGAIYLYSGSLNISGAGSEISSNCAYGGGGAINVYGGTLTITDAAISNNGSITGVTPATNIGGGIFFGGDNLTVTDSSFDNNQATGNGGGIHQENTGDMTITGSTFSSNESGITGGGGIFSSTTGAVVVNGTDFSDNHTDGTGGGGVYLSSEGGANFNACSFVSNTAGVTGSSDGSGGAILILENSPTTVVNSFFYDNHAYDYTGSTGVGGAISYQSSSASSSNTYINLAFYSNHASGNNGIGGAFYSIYGDHSFYNSVFYGNTADDTTTNNISANGDAGDTFGIYNSFYYGGAYIDTDLGFTGDSSNITGNSESPFESINDEAANFLYPNSYIIDLGDSSQVPNGITEDLAGNTRIAGSAVDIGAYEWQGE